MPTMTMCSRRADRAFAAAHAGDLAGKHLLHSRPTGNAATATTADVTYPARWGMP